MRSYRADLSASLSFLLKQEQQRVAVRPGNAEFISIRQLSSDAATLRRAARAAASALLRMLLCIGNLLIKC